MTTPEEVEKALSSQKGPDRKVLAFAALLGQEAQVDLIVVGGSAIEIYTQGGYVSGDIDLVGDPERIRRALARWGFKDHGRLWIRDDWKIAVDVVGAIYTGDPYRLATVETPFGPVRVAALEDLIVKRLAEAKHWQVRAALEEASLLWSAHREKLDQAYLDKQARTYDVVDLLEDLRRIFASPG